MGICCHGAGFLDISGAPPEYNWANRSLLIGPEGLAFGPDGYLYVSVRSFFGAPTVCLPEPWSRNLTINKGLAYGPDGYLYVSIRSFFSSPSVCLPEPWSRNLTINKGLAYGPDGYLYVSIRSFFSSPTVCLPEPW